MAYQGIPDDPRLLGELQGMRYPFSVPTAPNHPIRVAEGIDWIRMPMPAPLDHVNLWLLQEERDLALVDCGQFDAPTISVWNSLLTGHLQGRTISTILLTHAHADHVGCAGMLVERTGARPFISNIEADALSARLDPPDDEISTGMIEWLRRCGFPPDRDRDLVAARLGTRRQFAPRPRSMGDVEDGREIALGRRLWEVRLFGGHSPGMITLFDREAKMLIAGDQVLPTISPLIGNHPAETRDDPLGEYLDSLDVLADLPEDTLVLPSHGEPFYGLRIRIDQLRSHHLGRLAVMEEAAAAGATIFEVASRLFPQAVTGKAARQALCETQSHLVHLERTGRMVAEPDATGAVHYRRI